MGPSSHASPPQNSARGFSWTEAIDERCHPSCPDPGRRSRRRLSLLDQARGDRARGCRLGAQPQARDSVEAVFAGPEQAVADMIALCRRGPDTALG